MRTQLWDAVTRWPLEADPTSTSIRCLHLIPTPSNTSYMAVVQLCQATGLSGVVAETELQAVSEATVRLCRGRVGVVALLVHFYLLF
jgi:hypothetical protein